jgi:hypothetical protein
LRTRLKRLARKTVCFSQSVLMHDTVIGHLPQNQKHLRTPHEKL